MAPSETTIVKALKDGVAELYRKDPDVLTVKYVRNHVAGELGIAPSFFTTPEWKIKSKEMIVDAVVSNHFLTMRLYSNQSIARRHG